MSMPARRFRVATALAVTATAALGLTACSSSGSGGSSGGGSVTLVGFSTPKPAYDALAKAFFGDSGIITKIESG